MQYSTQSMTILQRSFLMRYIFAFCSVILALPATFALRHNAPGEIFLFFMAAVVITASWAGVGPAIVALLLVLPLCAYYFLDPIDSFAVTPSGVYALLAFASVGTLLIALTESLRGARESAAAAYEQVEEARRYTALLSEVSRALISLPDIEQSLSRAANMIAADFADWCILDLFREDAQGEQRLYNVCVAHQDATQAHQARALQNVSPWDRETTEAYAQRVRSGSIRWAYTADQVTPTFLQSVTRNSEHTALLQSLGIVSFLCLPLRSGEEAHGTMILLSCKSGREYKVQDIDVAQELALRIAQTISNRNICPASSAAREQQHRAGLR